MLINGLNMKLKTVVFFLFCFSGLYSEGQTVEIGRDSVASVLVHKDARFDELAFRQSEINRRAQALLPKWIQGWRIQVSNTQNRDEANTIKSEMLRRYPDQKSYLLYKAPNFIVRVGDFLIQKDAFKLRKQIAGLYPGKGIYIVPDVIEVPPVGENADAVDKQNTD